MRSHGVSNEDALKAQEESGAKLGDILVQRGFINEEQLSSCDGGLKTTLFFACVLVPSERPLARAVIFS